MITTFTLDYFVTVPHYSILYKLIFFEKLKTSVEACHLLNTIFINSLVNFYKEKKITGTFLNNVNTIINR